MARNGGKMVIYSALIFLNAFLSQHPETFLLDIMSEPHFLIHLFAAGLRGLCQQRLDHYPGARTDVADDILTLDSDHKRFVTAPGWPGG